MGTQPIVVTSASTPYGRALINGQNFPASSVIYLDGTAYPTAFISSAQLAAIVPRGTPVEEIAVAQVAPDGTEFSRTESFIVGG